MCSLSISEIFFFTNCVRSGRLNRQDTVCHNEETVATQVFSLTSLRDCEMTTPVLLRSRVEASLSTLTCMYIAGIALRYIVRRYKAVISLQRAPLHLCVHR